MSRARSVAVAAAAALLALPAGAQARLAVADGGISVLEADGSSRARVAGPIAFEPAWSPDGTTFVFAHRELEYDSQLMTVPASPRSAQEAVPRPLPGGQGLSEPAFSPDGAWIAAVRTETDRHVDRRSQIVVLPAGGGTPRTIVGDGLAFGPAWSPDGSTIAFARLDVPARGPITSRIVAVAPDGSGERTLVADAGQPAWSPDGRSLAFVSVRDRHGSMCFHECSPSRELYVAAADGSAQRRVTITAADEADPAWSPDGTRIAVAVARDEGAGTEIVTMDPDGGCRTQVTFAASEAAAPAWEPGRPASRGPCGGRAAPFLLDVDPARSKVAQARAMWLGERFGRRYVSDVDRGVLVYGECGEARVERCPPSVQIQTFTTCRRNPARLDVPVRSALRRRGALVLDYGDRFEVLHGGTTTVLWGVPRRRLGAALAALRPVRADRAPRRLAAPRLPGAARRALERSARGVSGGRSRALVRSDRRVWRELRRFGAAARTAPQCARR